MIYGGNSQFSKGRMGAMVTTWARTLGIATPAIEVDENGCWCTNDGYDTKPILPGRGGQSSAIHLLKNIAQAVVRKEVEGSCPPVYLDFYHHMSDFGLISLLDFIRGICKEKQIQFLISMKEVPSTEPNIQVISEHSI